MGLIGFQVQDLRPWNLRPHLGFRVSGFRVEGLGVQVRLPAVSAGLEA